MQYKIEKERKNSKGQIQEAVFGFGRIENHQDSKV